MLDDDKAGTEPVDDTAAAAPAGTDAAAPAADGTGKAPAPAPTATDKPAADPKAAPAKPAGTSILDDADDEPEDDDEPVAKADGDKPAGTDPKVDDKAKAAAKWPDDWREKIAGDDAKWLGELKRYASFDAFVKSQKALRQKLSSGEYKKAAAFDETWDDATKAEWRKENGIPDKPTGYEVPKIAGHEWSEADKPGVEAFMARMHAKNANPAVVQEALTVYGEALANAKERLTTIDREDKIKLEDELRSEWGTDYRANVNLMKRALGDVEVFPGGTEKDGLGLALAEARLSNGKRLINHPAFPTFLAQLAREKYGEGGMLPSSEVAALSSREDEIVKLMRSDIDAYHKARNSKGQLWSDELLEIRRRKTGGKAA